MTSFRYYLKISAIVMATLVTVLLPFILMPVLLPALRSLKEFPSIIPENVVTTGTAVLQGGDTKAYVNIEMTKGKRPDESTSEWEGRFQIRVHNGSEDSPYTYSIQPIKINGNKKLKFKDSFPLVIDDYNNNDRPDFTLGQYFDDHGSVYEIYTITMQGDVMRMKHDGNGILYIVEWEPSIQLKKTGDGRTFAVPSYDQAKGEIVTKEYRFEWDADEHYVLNS